jgi:hypothetical protein
MKYNAKKIWLLICAGCNSSEISAYYKIPEMVATIWILKAKREAYAQAVA